MKLEDQVTSLELSKKLKELGVKQESYFYWLQYTQNGKLINRIVPEESTHPTLDKRFSAFTVAELGEMLPDLIRTEPNELVGTGTTYLTIQKVGLWEVGYTLANGEMVFDSTEDQSEANARAKMICYLIEQGLMKP